jgi:hypothetical protein
MLIQTPDATAPGAERMTEADPRPAAAGRSSDVRGVIDNATPDRLYGWAWDFGHPAHRVRVVLRIAGETLAEARADGARPDLAKAGIGDGCHAFELPLHPEWRDRLAELAVVAFGDDGHEYPIAVRLPRLPAQPTHPIQRSMESVIAEQRDLRRELVALREQAGRHADQPAAAPAIEALQTRVQQRRPPRPPRGSTPGKPCSMRCSPASRRGSWQPPPCAGWAERHGRFPRSCRRPGRLGGCAAAQGH